jgi:hypothetical protein
LEPVARAERVLAGVLREDLDQAREEVPAMDRVPELLAEDPAREAAQVQALGDQDLVAVPAGWRAPQSLENGKPLSPLRRYFTEPGVALSEA